MLEIIVVNGIALHYYVHTHTLLAKLSRFKCVIINVAHSPILLIIIMCTLNIVICYIVDSFRGTPFSIIPIMGSNQCSNVSVFCVGNKRNCAIIVLHCIYTIHDCKEEDIGVSDYNRIQHIWKTLNLGCRIKGPVLARHFSTHLFQCIF